MLSTLDRIRCLRVQIINADHTDTLHASLHMNTVVYFCSMLKLASRKIYSTSLLVIERHTTLKAFLQPSESPFVHDALHQIVIPSPLPVCPVPSVRSSMLLKRLYTCASCSLYDLTLFSVSSTFHLPPDHLLPWVQLVLETLEQSFESFEQRLVAPCVVPASSQVDNECKRVPAGPARSILAV